MILWKKDFETGSLKLNEQHRLLVDSLNLLKEHLNTVDPSNDEMIIMVHLVDYLQAYTNIHFKGEERCMERYRCPAHAENRVEHERFRGFIRDYKKLCEIEGFKVELLRNLHQVMRTWVAEHILKIDTQLMPCVGKQRNAVLEMAAGGALEPANRLKIDCES